MKAIEKAKECVRGRVLISDGDRSSTSHGQRQGSELNTRLSFTFSTNKVPSFRERVGGKIESLGKKKVISILGFMPADRFVAYRYRNIYESSFV